MKTDSDIDKFVKLVKQIKNLISEFSVLSKKKPDDAVNKFKIKLINPVLEVANYFVNDKKYKPFADFELFNEDDLTPVYVPHAIRGLSTFSIVYS